MEGNVPIDLPLEKSMLFHPSNMVPSLSECSLPLSFGQYTLLQKPGLERLSDFPEVLSSLYTQKAGHIARAQEVAMECC